MQFQAPSCGTVDHIASTHLAATSTGTSVFGRSVGGGIGARGRRFYQCLSSRFACLARTEHTHEVCALCYQKWKIIPKNLNLVQTSQISRSESHLLAPSRIRSRSSACRPTHTSSEEGQGLEAVNGQWGWMQCSLFSLHVHPHLAMPIVSSTILSLFGLFLVHLLLRVRRVVRNVGSV